MAITPQVADRYRRLRRKHVTLGADQALRWAKFEERPMAFDWSGSSGRHVRAATTTCDGFDVRVVVDYDEYADRRAEYTDNDTGIRNPDFDWTDDGGYRHRNNERKGKRYIELESGYTVPDLASDYNKMGMSKSVALDVARQSLASEAREYLSDEWASYVVTVKVSVAGIELGTASLGGIETGGDYSDEREFESAVIDHDLIREAIDEARENMARLVAAKTALDTQVPVC